MSTRLWLWPCTPWSSQTAASTKGKMLPRQPVQQNRRPVMRTWLHQQLPSLHALLLPARQSAQLDAHACTACWCLALQTAPTACMASGVACLLHHVSLLLTCACILLDSLCAGAAAECCHSHGWFVPHCGSRPSHAGPCRAAAQLETPGGGGGAGGSWRAQTAASGERWCLCARSSPQLSARPRPSASASGRLLPGCTAPRRATSGW